jgi:lipopolysaccharide transport system permease protein
MAPFTAMIEYKDLIVFMVKAELKSRHFRKMLGPIWWVLEPMLQAFIFFFLTKVLFHYEAGENYLLFLILSVIIWRWFARPVDNAPSLLLSYQAIISQTNFRILPMVYSTMMVELIYFLFGLMVIFAVMPFFGVWPSMNMVFLPYIMLVQGTFTLGLVSLIGRIGIFVRDLQQIVWVITSIWFYLSPGIYPVELVPSEFRQIYELNPFATILTAYRDVMIDGVQPDLLSLTIWFGIFIGLMYVGTSTIERARGKFYKAL